MGKALISATPKPATGPARGPILPTQKKIYRKYADLVDEAVWDVLEMYGTPDYIKQSKLRSISRLELHADIGRQLAKGFSAPSRFAGMRMRKAVRRFMDCQAKHHGGHITDLTPKSRGIGFDQKTDQSIADPAAADTLRGYMADQDIANVAAADTNRGVDGYRSNNSWKPLKTVEMPRKVIDLNPDLPALSQGAILRIAAKRIDHRHQLESALSNYYRELQRGSGLTRALTPEAHIKQHFNAFAVALSEAHAIEHFTAHGKDGVARWLDTVVAEVLETTVPFGGDYVSYPGLGSGGREDLEAVVEAAVHRVINGTGSWRGNNMSRRDRLEWFKAIKHLGKKNDKVYRAARVDRWSFDKWLRGLLPDSSSISKRIELLLRSGCIN